MGRTAQTTKTNQSKQTTNEQSKKNEIPIPAPVKAVLEDFEDDVDTGMEEFDGSPFKTTLGMYEVKDEIKVRQALFNARDRHNITSDGTLCIFFAQGKIDNWCAYVAERDRDYKWHLYAPKDEFYFERVLYIARELEKTYPNRKESAFERVYHEVLHIAEIMFYDPKHVSDVICNEIDRIVEKYAAENEAYRGILSLALYELYYGMIAEENKDDTTLGRKIKMIGLHDLLIKRKGVKVSCDCNKEQNRNIIQHECDKLGVCWLSANESTEDFVIDGFQDIFK